MLAIGGAVVLAVIGIGAALALGGGDDDPPGDARAALEAAGCTLGATPALEGVHSITTPDGELAEVEHRPAHERPPLPGAGRVGGLHRTGEPGAARPQSRARRRRDPVRQRSPRRDRPAAEGVRPGSAPRHRGRAVSVPGRPDRARRVGDRERLGAGEGHRVPCEVPGLRRGGVRRVPRRVSVPRARALPARHALTRADLAPVPRRGGGNWSDAKMAENRPSLGTSGFDSQPRHCSCSPAGFRRSGIPRLDPRPSGGAHP